MTKALILSATIFALASAITTEVGEGKYLKKYIDRDDDHDDDWRDKDCWDDKDCKKVYKKKDCKCDKIVKEFKQEFEARRDRRHYFIDLYEEGRYSDYVKNGLDLYLDDIVYFVGLGDFDHAHKWSFIDKNCDAKVLQVYGPFEHKLVSNPLGWYNQVWGFTGLCEGTTNV
jgi:hypothetical protein